MMDTQVQLRGGGIAGGMGEIGAEGQSAMNIGLLPGNWMGFDGAPIRFCKTSAQLSGGVTAIQIRKIHLPPVFKPRSTRSSNEDVRRQRLWRCTRRCHQVDAAGSAGRF